MTTYIYDRDADSWTQMANMLIGRDDHSCGVVEMFGVKEVVVAGGDFEDAPTTSEVYSVATNTWRQIEDLPHGIYYAASVPFRESFLIVGGYRSGVGHLDTIYEFDVENESWILRDEKMSEEKGYVTAMVVNAGDFPQCFKKWKCQ